MKYQFMKDHSEIHCISKMAAMLEVTRSGYYSWLNRPVSKRQEANDKLIELIKACQKDVKRCYGSRRVTLYIKQREQIPLGHNRVARLMKANNLGAKTYKKWRPKESKDLKDTTENLLNRDFEVKSPNTVWVSDITYVYTTKGWWYLCPIMDLSNREIIGWTFDDNMEDELAINALNNAKFNTNNPRGVLLHTDRGSQFTSAGFIDALKKDNFIRSLSRRGNCWDNACIESFFKSLKVEWLYPAGVLTPDQTRLLIFEYIEIFYNRKRLHSSLGYTSPMEYEKKPA